MHPLKRQYLSSYYTSRNSRTRLNIIYVCIYKSFYCSLFHIKITFTYYKKEFIKIWFLCKYTQNIIYDIHIIYEK